MFPQFSHRRVETITALKQHREPVMLDKAKFDFIHTATAALEGVTFERRERLFEDMDKFMNPVLKAARTSATEAQVEEWIEALPLGYYRQTLRVITFERWHQPVIEEVIAAAPIRKTAPVTPHEGFRKGEAAVIVTGYAAAINAAIAESESHGRD
ncbi:hypothetical protein [Paraburkholderia sp.]|uniref:hypothetical protein n=1 Tax=Paraburkholderia sp. TaxID=1926495 RepID=UPI0039E46186